MVASDPFYWALNWLLEGFNPLHCGAVVASGLPDHTKGFTRLLFQSPSLRGSGRFKAIILDTEFLDTVVSIPFIAGQWSLLTDPDAPWVRFLEFQSPSLRGSGRFTAAVWRAWAEAAGFNPLHCGAVVASLSPRRLVLPGDSSFNPLHCGAVVASRSLWRLISST